MSDIPRDPYDSSNPPPIPPGVTDIEPVLSSDAKNIAMLCHLLAFTKYFTGVGHILGPLIVWLWKKDDHPFVDEHGKESLNFQLTMLIAVIVSVILMIVLIGFLLLWLLGIANLVLIIIATIRASENKIYRYPVSIRFIK